VRQKTTDGAFRLGKSFLDAELGPLHIIDGMLAGKVRITGKNDSLTAPLIIPDCRSNLLAIRDIHHQSTNRIGPEVQTDGISFCHGVPVIPVIL
jgi:hypothetical protein